MACSLPEYSGGTGYGKLDDACKAFVDSGDLEEVGEGVYAHTPKGLANSLREQANRLFDDHIKVMPRPASPN